MRARLPYRPVLASALLCALANPVVAADSERWLVQFVPDGKAKLADRLAKRGLQVVQPLAWINAAAVRVDAAQLAALRADPEVLLIEPDPLRYPAIQQVPPGITQVQSTNLWSAGATGSNVLACVIDSGIEATHEDFQDNPPTVVDKLHGGSPSSWESDACGHGTHVAGTLAANNNTVGVIGVAHAASLYVVRVFAGDAQSCGSSFGSNILAAAQECASVGAQLGRRVVINLSLGGDTFSSVENSGFQALYNSGAVLTVAAAGNAGNTALSYPASYDSVISVGAVDANKAHASFSQRNAQVELAAPGVAILSTYPLAIDLDGGNPAGYARLSGTSMASPHVAGVAAAIWSAHPTRTAAEVRAALTSTAEDLGTSGRDDLYGFGFVRAASALANLQVNDTSPPSAPAALTASANGASSALLSWTASSDTGGSGLTGYKIERCLGGSCSDFVQVGTSASPAFTSNGLVGGTSYRFRVRAHDGSGNHSAYSNIAGLTTGSGGADTAPPAAPGNLRATASSSTTIGLTWTAAVDSGGSGIGSYRIDRCTGATCTGFTQIATASGTSYTNSNLAAATSYRYRVRAVDRAGNLGTYSAVAAATTGADTVAPAAPATLTATATGSTVIALSWPASTDTGGAGVGGYRVERCLGSSCSNYAQVGTASGTSFTSSNLAAATAYRFRVRAVDRADNLGAYSPVAAATTANDTLPPGAPNSPSATAASSTSISLRWSGALDSGGSGIGGYRIERCLGTSCSNFAQVGSSGGTSYTATSLAAASTYRFRVRAADRAGNLGPYSSIVSATTAADVQPPDAPSTLSVDPTSSTSLTLRWTAPADTGGAGIGGYRIERCLGTTCSNFAQVGSSGGTSYVSSGLAASTSYRYRVRAFDRANNLGAYSPLAGATTLADTVAPAAVSTLSASAAGSTSIQLSWSATTDSGGAGIGGYRIERCLGASCSNFAQVGSSSGTSYLSAGLAASTAYRYRVRAFDRANNLGPYSPLAGASTGADAVAPGAVTSLTATATGSTTIELSWPGTADTGGAGIAGYRIERCQGASCSSFAQIGTATTTRYVAGGLVANTAYRFRIRSIDRANNLGPYSPIAGATTAADTIAPGVPANLAATATSATAIRLTWTATTDTGGSGLGGYRVERCTGAGCSNFSQIGTTSGTSFSVANAVTRTSYRFRIRAFDRTNNLGAYSSIAEATTP